MNTRTVDPATYEPLYTCTTCNTPVVPNDTDTYTKEHRHFCSIGCLYTYYEGEPAAEDDDYQP